MYEVFKKKETARVREYHLKITGQHCNFNLRNNTNHIFSIFSKTNFEHKRSFPSSPRRKGEVIGTLAKKFNLRIALRNKSGRNK